MKPRELKSLFSTEGFKTSIKDRVWHIAPRYCDETPFTFDGFASEQYFGNHNPLHIEYCSGNGGWIADQALRHPECNWLAIERKFCRVQKIWAKIKNFNLNNLFVLYGEGHYATERYFPMQCAKVIYINFPDPWPKNKHAKHRLIGHSFIRQLERILCPEGVVIFVTDDYHYSQWTTDHFSCNSAFTSRGYVVDWPGYGSSFFEELWRKKGKEIRYHQYIRR